MSANPFQQASKVSKKLKVLIYGLPGTGKTRAALTFPRPAVIDSEGGTDLYAGRAGMPEFSVMRAKSMEELNTAIAFIQADKGKTFETLVIDPITVFYDVQKEAAVQALVKAGKKDELTYRDWGKINARMSNLYNALTNLPVHVVVIARESLLYANDSTNLKVIGAKAEADKKIEYMFDFVVRTRKDQPAEVIKSRGVGLGKELQVLSWDVFARAAGMFTDGQTITVQNDENAALRDVNAFSDAPAPVTPQKSAAPAWWGVLAEYKPFMPEADFNRMRSEMSESAKNGTLKLSDDAAARTYIEKLWDTAIDFDGLLAARKDADEMPA